MPNPIVPKKSSTPGAIPTSAQLLTGEIASNLSDGLLFLKKADGTIVSIGQYTLPKASASVLGGVKIGSGISIDENGVISAASSYVLPTASDSVLGGVKVGAGLSISGTGVLSATYSYSLPVATASVLGGVKQGSGVTIAGDGTISVTTYTLPAATTTTLGGVIVGTGLAVSSGMVSVSYGTTSTTACAGNDSRLSDARTPAAHASTHATGGSDPITPASIGAQKTITVSSSAPSGGSSGDIWLQTAASGQVSVTLSSASVNDLNPGAGDIFRLSYTAAATLTGWTAWSDGTVKLLVNVGSFNITIKHQSASSSASNRFITPTTGDYVLVPGASMIAYYDATDSRVRVF